MRNLVLAVLMSFLALPGMAQQKPDKRLEPADRAQKMTEKMQQKLELSRAQAESLYEANLRLAEASHELQDQRRALRAQHRQQLQDILSEEQWQQLRQLHRESRARQREQRHQDARPRD